MTNDTSTLTGALKEAGETLAANLTTQGVPSTWDEGLTTLIGKVLNITPGPTPSYDGVSLTSDKSILSYADSESATLTAQLLDGSSSASVSGVTVEFFNGSTSLGTATTNSNGVATKSYSSTGAGDVSLTASAGTFVSETYVIEDCSYYNTSEVSRTTTQGSTIYDNNLSQTLPSKCEISYDMSADNVTSASERRCFVLPKSQFSTGTSQPSYALFSQIAGSKLTVATRDNGSNVNEVHALTSVTNNQYYNIKFIRDGTTVSRYVDDVKVDDVTVSFFDNYTDWTLSMIRWSATGTSKIKNVKFKPL